MRRLVVVGNGMAGIRAIEEVLARTGGDMFDITVFGDEPYGNYNRILLSNVLAGSDDPAEIYLNALDWYSDNRIDLRPASGWCVRHLRPRRARGRRHQHALRQAHPGHGQPVLLPAHDGCGRTTRPSLTGSSASVPSTTTATMIAEAPNRTKAVVIGGGLLGLEAARGTARPRADRRRGACGPDPDERPTRRPRRCDPAQVGGGPWHRRAHREAHHRSRRGRQLAASGSPTVPGWTATCW